MVISNRIFVNEHYEKSELQTAEVMMGTQHTRAAAIYGRTAVAVSLFSLSTP